MDDNALDNYKPVKWPGWFYGPNGEAEIFQSEDEVPKGWLDHPAKFADKVDEDKPRRGRPPKAPVEESEF